MNFHDFMTKPFGFNWQVECPPDVPSVFGSDKYTILELIGKLMRWKVSTVNGVEPDENGNVNVTGSKGENLTFTGAVSAVYDGTRPVTVNIPGGGTGAVESVNGKTGAVVLTATDVNAVTTSRTVNGKSLSNNIWLNANDVSALPDTVTKLPNPQKVTFVKGDVTTTYDGSTALTVTIPTSGGQGGAVDSVNGKTGDVVLSASDVGAVPTSRTVNGYTLSNNIVLGASDVGALPSTYTPPVTSVNGETGSVVINIPEKLPNPNAITFTGASTGTYDGSSALTINIPSGGGTGAVESVNGKTGVVVIGNEDVGAPSIDEFQQIEDDVETNTVDIEMIQSTLNTELPTKYSASNPPPYPVTQVNGNTGNVTITLTDLNGVPNTRKVNGKSLANDITLNAGDVNALPSSTTKLPNPNAITFTGASTGTYDGSSALTINIPSGGGGGGIYWYHFTPSWVDSDIGSFVKMASLTNLIAESGTPAYDSSTVCVTSFMSEHTTDTTANGEQDNVINMMNGGYIADNKIYVTNIPTKTDFVVWVSGVARS